MGNACCNERTDPETQANKIVKLAEPTTAPDHQGSKGELPSTHRQDVENFKRGPSDYFTLNDKILNSIAKHPIANLSISNSNNSTASFEKYESKGDERPHKYFGQRKSGIKDGLGQIHYLDEKGEFVVTTFSNGVANGYGAAYFPNGDHFQGEFRYGQICQGILYLANNEKYEGAFENGHYHGKGQLTLPDGRKYVGEFSKGLRNGYGNYAWPNGSSYNGNWKDGKQHGLGVYTDDKGARFEGEFFEGKKLVK
jgi:hypothetical protein